MKYTHYFIFAIVLLLGFAAMAAVATDKAKTPSQSYLDYRAALEKATTLDEVLPFLSMAYCGMLEARPKEDHPVWLQRLKEAEEMKDVKIIRENIHGGTCTVITSGTSAKGNAIKGKITMVLEGGAWKLDESVWTT
jgi:hypothetical protein